MEETQKEKMISMFNRMSNREKAQILQEMSAPWIKKEVLKYNATSIQQIIKLMEKSENAERRASILVKKELDSIRGNTRFTVHKYKKKRRR